MSHNPPPLPDAIIEGLRQLVNDSDGRQWVMGDYINAVVDELEGHYSDLGVKYARAWLVRHMAERTGADVSTLRDRANMAKFYPQDIRTEYDALSYHQLRACKSAGEEWKRYADWALDNLPSPVSVIRAMVKHNGDLPPAWVSRWERMQVLADVLVMDALTPPEVRGAAWLVGFMSGGNQ